MTAVTLPSKENTNTTDTGPYPNMVKIPDATFVMGAKLPGFPEEGPTHSVTISGFWMDKYQVTNLQFEKFVKQTGYITFAEKPPIAEDYPEADPAMLVAGSAVFIKPSQPADPRTVWRYITDAYWRQPEGLGSSIVGREHHPVVHVVYEDAFAYAQWAGKELPTEAEWELAARGGLDEATYAWGDTFKPNGTQMANTWLGKFPHEFLGEHSPGTQAVGSYPVNQFGLYDIIGNVWEWTSDWYQERHTEKPCCAPLNPKGGSKTASLDKRAPKSEQQARKVLKGGSFLCAQNYCARFRPAARHPEPLDTSTNHIGMRMIVRDC